MDTGEDDLDVLSSDIMQLLHPWFLWFLLALAIPIIIHLFHFRRFKKVYFTNVRFLREIKEEKSTRNKLRNILVLLSRLAALACLVLAFAQPFLGKDDQKTKSGKNNVSIFIDNSFSMEASSEDVPLLAKAKRKAEEIIKAYSNTDQFQILSHELKGSQTRWLNQENAVINIDEIEITPEVNPLSTTQLKQEQSRPAEGNHIVYYLSDFQKSISDLKLPEDSISEFNLLPFQAIKERNISIDSAWFRSVVPAINQNNKLMFRLKNHSAEDIDDVRVSVELNGETRPEGTIDVSANSVITDTINLLITEPGWHRLKIKIEDYPIQFDDEYFIRFNIKEKVNVLSINQNSGNRYLNALFAGLTAFNLENVQASNIKYDEFENYSLIIVNDLASISSGLASELESYMKAGGNVLCFPAANAQLQTYNDFIGRMSLGRIGEWSQGEKKVLKINTSEFVFSDVYEKIDKNLKLPLTTGSYRVNKFNSGGGDYLLQYRDGQDYVSKFRIDRGRLFLCAAPLNKDYNDLTLNAEVFVPLLYKTAFSSEQNENIAYTIGEDQHTEVKTSGSSVDVVYKIIGEEEFIPGQSAQGSSTQLSFNNMISQAGFYDVKIDDNLVKGLAFNYNRLESATEYLKSSELTEKFGSRFNILDNSMNADLASIIKEKDQGISLWRWCLIAALIFLAIETLLLRFWKI